jgi:hypothetical protein
VSVEVIAATPGAWRLTNQSGDQGRDAVQNHCKCSHTSVNSARHLVRVGRTVTDLVQVIQKGTRVNGTVALPVALPGDNQNQTVGANDKAADQPPNEI